MADGNDRPLSNVVLVVGAAAGSAFIFSLVGAAVNWGRFYTLGLPRSAASATLSQSTLLLSGLNALAVPILAGLATAGVSLLLRIVAVSQSPDRPTWRSWYAISVGVWVLFLVFAGVFAKTPAGPYIFFAGSLVAASLAPWRWRWRRVSRRFVTTAVFISMVALGVLLVLWGIVRPPTKLERAELMFSNGTARVTGFWIAETDNTVYIAPQVGGREGPCQVNGEVLAFPRDDVARIGFDAAVEVWSKTKSPEPGACD